MVRPTRHYLAASRLISALVFAAFVFPAEAADELKNVGGADDKIAAKLDRALESYEKDTKPIRRSVLDALAKAGKSARKSGDLPLVQALAAEKRRFEASGDIPSLVKVGNYKLKMAKLNADLEKAFSEAGKAYVRNGQDELAKKVEQARTKFKQSQAGLTVGEDTYGWLIPTAEQGQPQIWWYTTIKPEPDWTSAGFKAVGWERGAAAFGKRGAPNLRINTPWQTDGIWLRVKVQLPRLLDSDKLVLRIWHDDDAMIYANGEVLFTAHSNTVSYVDVVLDAPQRSLLVAGENTIAVTCKNTGGDQGIDIGLQRLPAR